MVCDENKVHAFGRGRGSLIESHIKSTNHTGRARQQQSGIPMQPRANEALALLHKAARQDNRYPTSIPFSVHSPLEMRDHFRKGLCHGFFDNVVKVNGVERDVTHVKRQCCTPGKEWYASPHYEANVVAGGKGIHVQGTMRHQLCQGYNCEMCPLIPELDDYRMRVNRQSNVGERAGVQGVNFIHMDKTELVQVARDFKATCRGQEKWIFCLARKLALEQAKNRKIDLVEVATEAIESNDIPKVAEVFKRCASVGAFAGRSALLHFLLDLGQNLLSLEKNGNAKGFRFTASTKAFYEVLWHCGGRLVHEFVKTNLVGPSMITSKKAYRSLAFRYDGTLSETNAMRILELIAQVKEERGIEGPVPVEISEDETGVIPMATYNRRLDAIDGFCGTKGNDHRCSFDCRPSASTCANIQEAFKTCVVAKNVRLILVNVLAPRFPRFPLAILPTCMKFDATQVYAQWQSIRGNHKTHGKGVGPIVSHASDGDNRRRKLQLDSVCAGSFGLDRPGFIMKGEEVGEDVLLMDQDAVHCGKKWRNGLLHAHRKLYYGGSLATRNLLRLVRDRQNFSQSEHGLLESDIDPQDVQNFGAVQRLAFPRVRVCLESVAQHGQDCKGLILHLYILWCFLEVFFGVASLRERVRLASFVIHITYMSHAYVLRHGHGLTLTHNWLSRETTSDVLMAMHFAVNLIRLFRDRFPHLPVPLSRAGTDCCEDLFADVGQQTRNKHNATPGEFLERCTQMVRKEEIKSSESLGIKYMGNRRRENLWFKGNAYPSDQPSLNAYTESLMAYGEVGEEACLEAWDEGFELAKREAEKVGMRDTLEKSGEWDEPWKYFKQQLESRRSGNSDVDMDGEEDEEEECMRSCPTPSQGPGNYDIPAATPLGREDVAVGEIRAAVVDAVQEMDELQREPQGGGGEGGEEEGEGGEGGGEGGDEGGGEGGKEGGGVKAEKISPLVYVPELDMYVHKMTLIAQMNHCEGGSQGKLPVDRLQRVRFRVSDKSDIDAIGDVGLFDNVCVAIEGSDGMYAWFLANVLVMTKVTDKGGNIDYQMPVTLSNEIDCKSVKFTVKYYKALNESDPNNTLFSYGGFEGKENDPVPLSAVISRVCSLKRNAEGNYELGDEELADFNAFVANTNDRRKKKRNKRKERQVEEEVARADDGRADKRVGQSRAGRSVKMVRNVDAMFLK